MVKRFLMTFASLLLAIVTIAGGKLSLQDITRGEYRHKSMAAVQVLPDGESYAQLSSDGRRIVRCSFQTGREVGVLFDVSTAKGAQLAGIDGYIMSPDGKRLLIQTKTERIYRHSFTAVYYI